MGPSESRTSVAPVSLMATYIRPSVPPSGAETQAEATAPAGETASVGAVPTSVDALSLTGAPNDGASPCAQAASTTVLAVMIAILERIRQAPHECALRERMEEEVFAIIEVV